MPYDSRATLVTRLTTIRTAIDAARSAESYTVADRGLKRPNLAALLEEEKLILEKIELIDRYSSGFANKVKFARPV